MLRKSLLILLIATGTVSSLFADEIERDSRYIFVEHAAMGQNENDRFSVVKVLDAKTNKLVAELSGNEEIDSMTPLGAISSDDGKYVAYCIGGPSMGREIRLFRLTSHGPEKIPFDPIITENQDNIFHLYVMPIRIGNGKLLYNVRMDGSKDSQHFTKHYERVFKIPGT